MFPVKSLLCTGRIESIEWQDLEQRQHINDYPVIHLPHWGLCALLLASHHTFSARRIDPSLRLLRGTLVIFVLKHVSHFRSLVKWVPILCCRFCVSTFVASPSESEFSLSEECASTCASRSSRLTVKGCNQTRMPCVGSSLFISFAGSRFTVVCLSWSVSIGFPHACLSLRVVTGSNDVPNFLELIGLIRWSRCWRQTAAGTWWQSWYNEKYWVVHCTSNRLPSLGQSWKFAVFNSYKYPRYEQSWWSDRIAGVSSSNCTVTNRSRSWTKTCAYSFLCTAPDRGKSLMVFWTSQSIHFIWDYISLAQHCALKLPNPQLTYDLLCLWRLHKRMKRSCLRLWACISSRQILRYFSCTICLSWGFLEWLFLKTGRARISLMRFTFLDNASRLPVSFPNSILYQVHPDNFLVCPAEAFNPNCSTYRRIEFIGSESWDTHPWTLFFSFRIATAPWVPSSFRIRAGFPFTVRMSK